MGAGRRRVEQLLEGFEDGSLVGFRIRARFGFGGEVEKPVPLEGVELRAPRLTKPSGFGDLYSDGRYERVSHALGKAYRDVVRGFYGKFENPPDLVDWLASEMQAHDVKPEIEAFDLSHIVQAARMARDGRLRGPLYVQFVMGVKNAMPADEPIFDFYIETLKRLAPDAQWCAAGIGAEQLRINEWAVAKGGHTRTGMEDNVRLDRDTLAPSNAALVRRVVELCERHGRPVATWQQARQILGLRAA